ncbi:acetyl-CoA carboxylase biotin carboxylase subunit [Mariprofundus erugo]|uniref:Acetyl-CoA carboxylase biotin carboxylase subunit n=1 Tax=Mariprofundus erugo TaxID=2528639 RepID=A0A5R9GJ47_9PROT|nr:acetyl-CoA carboxylase biotin carboxylase subunit [Mariprofundus erugo]TLS66686.1 acetyl-CoA carboxylase biotin carboxylase subunit [Mariprofundus erugo]TLS74554.1 acetyl-CoA carboxylase biotin carboxylase subunit [Mariprofundus erugo]
MFKRVLVANRGECAIRIIRSCRELGIESVAIYSEADAHALHVKKADRAVMIGPDPVKSYLNIHRIVNVALDSGCDAVHPGYGFLSENEDFARAVTEAGITYIGPSPDAIRDMGSKTKARETMIAAGVPVIPGSDGELQSIEQALELAHGMGYPVMLKAAAGGGGRGIRRCDNDEQLREYYIVTQREAMAAFGSDVLFMEKCIIEPHHIEFQILADSHGHIVHLFERDCSIQRRNQKLIEIAPSNFLTPELRQQMGEVAIKAARAVNYVNAGTVEFLVDKDRNFWFMEMNTRLQVEHTITETITGVDIVSQQIAIAAGEPLPFTQEELSFRGFAIEFRINAEDPKNQFLPTPGRITRYISPGGMGVRVDGCVYAGYEIPPYYDSMCAKLTVSGLDWKTTVMRAQRALGEYDIRGMKTTLPFYRTIASSEVFMTGEFDTGFMDKHPELLDYKAYERREDIAAAVAMAIAVHAGL